MIRVVLLMIAMLIGSAPASLAADRKLAKRMPAPFELTRSLNALQDQIALGSEAALAAQQGLLLRTGAQMLELDRTLWRAPVNARAAIGFVLSGGEPELLRVLLAEDALQGKEADLAKAALAYATGRWDEASEGFEEFEAQHLPPALGAHVALVQASLAMPHAPEEAHRFLETARLLAPGTLVEEAALRRQLLVESRLASPERFVSIARHYFRRFPNSIYGANLRHALPELWAELGLPGSQESFDQLDLMLAELAPAARRGVYLSFARKHALAADREFARHAALRAGEFSRENSTDKRRAALYGAMVEVVGVDWENARQSLHAMDPVLLSAEDRGLHQAALAILDELESPAIGTDDADSGDLPPSSLADHARAAIAATDALLWSMP